jgi:8-oxo-dGTP pyrophosphatase MutT (NUDIX family)
MNINPKNIYFGNRGAGILIFCKSSGRFLIQLRSKFVNEGNTYGIYGGRIEISENFYQGALRELREETGYNGKIKLYDIYRYEDKEAGFIYQNFLGLVEREFIPQNNWECYSHHWLTYNQLENIYPKHFGLKRILENNKKELLLLTNKYGYFSNI